MKTTAKTIALVRLILGEIDMWERQLQDFVSQMESFARIDDDDMQDEVFQADRAERMTDMLVSAFEVITGAHGQLLHDQRAQHVCEQALKASQDALKYATPLTWTHSAHKR